MKHTSITRIFCCFLLCTVLLSVLCIVPVCAATDTVTVGQEKNSIGPDQVNSYYDFEGTIVVAEGVTEIKDNTFNGLKIKEIRLPSTLETIGESAFQGCKMLTEISIPESVTSIGCNAFADCDALKTVYYNAISCEDSTAIGGFFDSQNAITMLVIGLRVERIPALAFTGSANLPSLFIPGNVKTIGKEAFSGCKNLATLTFGEGLQTIEAGAFESCSALKEVTIPNSVTKIDSTAFLYCSDLVIHTENPDLIASGDDHAYDDSEKEGYWDEVWTGLAIGFGSIAVVVLILLLLIVLYILAVQIIFLVGNLKLTRRYREITGKRVAWASVIAVLLSLLGFGIWYMIVIAILNHNAAGRSSL